MKTGTHYLVDCINITSNQGHRIESANAQRQLDRLTATPKVFQEMNWELLREQKLTLCKLASNYDLTKEERNNAINGIINLLDAIQDYAVDELGFDEKIVFDLDD